MKMKLIILNLLLFATVAVLAQESAVTAGGEATGAGGSQSYSLGQVLYVWEGPAAGKIEGLGVQQSYINLWEGYSSTNWGLASNWLLNAVPATGENVVFDLSPYNHLVLDQNRTIGNLINSQATYRTVLNGNSLTLNGSFDQTNNAKVDASATGSTLTFAGTATQIIPSATFYNDNAYNLAVANSHNVTLYGSLNLLGALSATSGYLDGVSQSPSVTYGGTSSQTIESNTWLNDQVYKLTIDNGTGVTNNAELTVPNNLIINSGALFTIAPDKTLTVNGTLTNSSGTGGFVLGSSSAGTASLLHNTDNVPGTAQRYIDGTASAWHFLSAPLSGQTIKGTEWTPSGTYGDGTGYDLYVWDEPTSCWVYNLNLTVTPTWPGVHPQTTFVPGRGYLYAVQATTPTKQFVGSLNNGTVSYSLTSSATGANKQFNFIGNPYPSSVDWNLDAGFSRSMLALSGAGYDMWTWSSSADNYGVYNSATGAGTNNVTRYIAPMQGFFVKATSAGTFSFNNAARVHTGASAWLKSKEVNTEENIFRTTVTSPSVKGQDEVLLIFGYNKNEDGAKKMFSEVKTAPSLYLPSGSENYSVRYLTDTKDNKQVLLSFKAGNNGNYTLNFSIPDTMKTVLLEDKLTSTVEDIKQTGKYNFSSTTSDNTNRFVIHFAEIENTTEIPVSVYLSGGQIVVDASSLDENFTARIYDTSGRLLFVKKLSGGQIESFPLRVKGLYLISVTTETRSKAFKIVN